MTSYRGAAIELTHPNGTTEGLTHNSTEVTFLDLVPATTYPVAVTFIFAGQMESGQSNHSGVTQDGGKSHDYTLSHMTLF